MAHEALKSALHKAIEGINLTREEAMAAMETIMSGEATDAQIGGFLVAMRLKGETVEEIASFTRIMREKAVPIDAGTDRVLDIVGTGGDGALTFNISTIAAFVAAGAGAVVAKHGNRSVSSKCGSADVMKELGINIDIPPEKVSYCLKHAGIAFLFAPKLHLSMKFAIGPRRELGIRTFFNILGPMTNPAGAKHLLLGVYSRELVEPLAKVLADLGTQRAFVVHGEDGLDEISTAADTFAAEVKGNSLRTFTITPEGFGFKRAKAADLLGGESAENAIICQKVLSGEKGPRRDVVVLNTVFALCAAGLAETPEDAVSMAERSIDSGAAIAKVQCLRELSNE